MQTRRHDRQTTCILPEHMYLPEQNISPEQLLIHMQMRMCCSQGAERWDLHSVGFAVRMNSTWEDNLLQYSCV